ncbi:tetratricopeptide repeat protein [Halarcobacter ebronensis]|uniref:tetratricopeptide repeat protein n=1 Tax=Halarcobacter ebronensis TaxID=1462615 RepID=UPI003C74DDD9
MKKIYSLFFIILILPLVSFSNEGKIDSQPEILFKYDKLKENQEKLRLQVEFNKAILLLEKEEYKKAIETFKVTSELLKVPSFLNIGIAYYKLGQIDNALLYLNNIYDYKEAIYSETYSYISASYYLYLIKKERKYLETIVNITKKFKTLTEHSKRLVVDTFILLKDYELALKILETMEFPMNMKKALLHLKLKDYIKAERYLQRAKEESFNQSRTNLILWLMVYRDLKANDIQKLLDRLKELEKVKDTFKVNQEYPLKIFFNKAKYTPSEYLNFVTKFDKDRKIDFLFYFAPFVFSDKQEILYDISKGFIFNSEQNVESLEQMVKYNAKFIEIIQEDPIIRVNKMQSFLKEDSNSYIYYNLALCYAQISDFHNAYKYFSKAYKLNPGNKLYSVMTLITAEKINRDIKDKEYIVQNIKSKDGMYKYFGQTVYKEYVEPKFKVIFDPLTYNQTIFYKALDYLDKLTLNRVTLEHPLFVEHYKDPLVYLMKSTIRREGENDYNYFARLQDKTPLNINNNFLEGPLVITKYYIDLLKAIGLFHKADLSLSGEESPSYLRTKALRELHNSKPKESLQILYSLQKKYKLEDKYTMYLIVASQLEDDKYNEALLQISLIKAILKDPGADFLTGVQLVQDLKLNSASQYFIEPYKDSLIDFKLLNFDSLLESM